MRCGTTTASLDFLPLVGVDGVRVSNNGKSTNPKIGPGSIAGRIDRDAAIGIGIALDSTCSEYIGTGRTAISSGTGRSIEKIKPGRTKAHSEFWGSIQARLRSLRNDKIGERDRG